MDRALGAKCTDWQDAQAAPVPEVQERVVGCTSQDTTASRRTRLDYSNQDGISMPVGDHIYRLYVDEVGNASTNDLSDTGRYLSLSGVIIKQGSDWECLRDEFHEFKERHFIHHSSENPIVLHRQKMVAGKPPFRCLHRKKKHDRVWSDLLSIIRRTPFTVITTGIDKKPHIKKHGANAWDPYDYCMLALMQRYVMFLGSRSARGDVMVESRASNSDKRLAEAFRRIYDKGCGRMSREIYLARLTSSSLKVKSKRINDPGLQLVDLVASPSDKMLRGRNGVVIDECKHIALDREIVRVLLKNGKYRTSNPPDCRLDGFGLVWIR